MSPIALETVRSIPQPSKLLTPFEAMGHRGKPVHAIPKFASHAEKRQWTLEHLAGAFRVFGREGYAEGIAGHISVCDPEFGDRFWINPLGVHFSMMRVSDLICLDMRGNVVDGNRVSSPIDLSSLSSVLRYVCWPVRPGECCRCLDTYCLPSGPP
jgi:hypothetical protein